METKYEEKHRVLVQESELLDEITAAQDAVRNAVVRREWADFEQLLLSMNGYKEQFELLEKERLEVFESEGEGKSFYSLIGDLPEAERRQLAEVYRNIKERALKVRLANDSLALYLEEAKSTLKAFMEAAFPVANGNTYSKNGRKVKADLRAMVMDTVL
jgi:hypothetical protein